MVKKAKKEEVVVPVAPVAAAPSQKKTREAKTAPATAAPIVADKKPSGKKEEKMVEDVKMSVGEELQEVINGEES
jgi:F420-dependent methylenetetrahydromethanopterin dehydrogenase